MLNAFAKYALEEINGVELKEAVEESSTNDIYDALCFMSGFFSRPTFKIEHLKKVSGE